MKFTYLSLLLSASLLVASNSPSQAKYVSNEVPKKMTVQTKKERFYYLVEPAVQKVHAELTKQYLEIKEDLQKGRNESKTSKLKKAYRVKTDKELLLALKPHPQSVAIAQAAMESGWATSRFFVQANNIFGMWSSNPNEARIAAGEKRGGTRTIWLRKFDTVEESVREYYKLMGRGRAYKKFRQTRYETDDVFQIIKKLDKYSEIGKKYVKELGSVIRYNKLTKYD